MEKAQTRCMGANWRNWFIVFACVSGCAQSVDQKVASAIAAKNWDAVFEFYRAGNEGADAVRARLSALPHDRVVSELVSCARNKENEQFRRHECVVDLTAIAPQDAARYADEVGRTLIEQLTNSPEVSQVLDSVTNAGITLDAIPQAAAAALMLYARDTFDAKAKTLVASERLCSAAKALDGAAVIARAIADGTSAASYEAASSNIQVKADRRYALVLRRATKACQQKYRACDRHAAASYCDSKFYRCDQADHEFGTAALYSGMARDDVQKLEGAYSNSHGDEAAMIKPELDRARANLQEWDDKVHEAMALKDRACEGRESCESELLAERCDGESTCAVDTVAEGPDLVAADMAHCDGAPLELAQKLVDSLKLVSDANSAR